MLTDSQAQEALIKADHTHDAFLVANGAGAANTRDLAALSKLWERVIADEDAELFRAAQTEHDAVFGRSTGGTQEIILAAGALALLFIFGR